MTFGSFLQREHLKLLLLFCFVLYLQTNEWILQAIVGSI